MDIEYGNDAMVLALNMLPKRIAYSVQFFTVAKYSEHILVLCYDEVHRIDYCKLYISFPNFTSFQLLEITGCNRKGVVLPATFTTNVKVHYSCKAVLARLMYSSRVYVIKCGKVDR